MISRAFPKVLSIWNRQRESYYLRESLEVGVALSVTVVLTNLPPFGKSWNWVQLLLDRNVLDLKSLWEELDNGICPIDMRYLGKGSSIIQ